MIEKNIIVALSDNRAIGKNNALLWHISEDLKYFKSLTTGYPIIMGRKTYESIGRPLPNRKNIVISRSGYKAEGIIVVSSLEDAFREAEVGEGGIDPKDRKCFIIGGGQIYAQAIDCADFLYLTKVHTHIEDADTFFPIMDDEKWEEKSSSALKEDPKSGYKFEFVVYESQERNK